jgi:hypothetical protein
VTREGNSILRSFVAAIVVAVVTLTAVFAIVGYEVRQVDRQQLHRLQDSLCGFFIPISGAPVTSKTQELGRTLVIASKHGAQVIQCPPPPKGHP